MKQFKLNYLLITLAFVSLLASCKKDKDPEFRLPTQGVYVLSQGNFNQNNSTLSYYDYRDKTTNPDIYQSSNGVKLGDTGNDVGIYGSKMYIVVNNSNRVTIADAKTAKLNKQITIAQPRFVVFYDKNAFVTSYNGTVSVIDTASLTITKTITVGRNPEQMAISNGKLYVANSGGLDFSYNFDKTVSVIDLTTLAETKKITVTDNPVSLAADSYNNIYVLSMGNYGGDATHPPIDPGMTVINAQTDVVRSKPAVSLGYSVPILAQGDFVYFPTADNKIAMFNAKTQTMERANFITDATTVTTPFALAFDKLTNQIFIADAKDYSSNGSLYVYDVTGKMAYSVTTGIIPGKIAFINK
ncbi:YncE family protein [Mucilaginibacter calamicampi]|uniref:YncE family protein n=1 Tax=Mucilaginibacter calamicampi TaxID=1302352 RepID=A0ABW2YY61_9SPHI